MAPSIVVREARLEDAPALTDVHLDSWDATYRGLVADSYIDLMLSQRDERVGRWRANLEGAGPEQRTWVIEREGAVVGFCSTGPSADEGAPPGSGEVYAIYLRPEVVGTGLGRPLFDDAVRDLRERGFDPLTLWVLRENAHARRFYEAAGWQPDGAEKTEQRPDALLHEVRYRAPAI